MTWGRDLWDQYENIEKHTQSGLDLTERYVKFVKERVDIELNYAKQLRNLSKKYTRRGGKEELDSKFSNHQAFQDILTELNDYAGQREVVAEKLTTMVCAELTRHLHELKIERKGHLAEYKKAQQNLELSFKCMENSKKKFEKEWREAEKAIQQAERIEQESASTKADVDKAKQLSHLKTHIADECKNDYAANLQKYNTEQKGLYYIEIPSIFNKLQDMDERRVVKLAEGYRLFAETEKVVMPIIAKCLDGINTASSKTSEKQDSQLFIELHKTGLVPPADVEFEDYSQGIKPAGSDTAVNQTKLRIGKKGFFNKKRQKVHPKKTTTQPPCHPTQCILTVNGEALHVWEICIWSVCYLPKPPSLEDFSHLPPEQRRKRLQQSIDEINKELQKEKDQSVALEKMKEVYVSNSQLGDPNSLEPQMTQTCQTIHTLKGKLAKYEAWLSEAGGETNTSHCINAFRTYLEGKSGRVTVPVNTSHNQDNFYEDDDFYEDFDDPLGQCTALYSFDGSGEGTVCMQEGELLTLMEKDQGDGWVRVRRRTGDEGYVPASYVKIS
uniref:Thyroid hormone receptor interactor 10b n=1 Tax=Denticeps clupeoides TaxID=299321 RepID=A0AAY4BEZ5_9TELE